ncbi:hypothetical protein GQ43DRAFT_421925 [Delitschia confertaspora ATCC 74209]|uniref:MOSC domain-containing protein n=1 Tax=Delitschia confertaspora ATCC 74209 TaxID=1513339 RepID=A0A9P4JI40_9PLEO|nr:hypothetical protein GQ43DRAFT_421925 [Delitschia confertaspora ATCC 74209]
MSGNLLDSFWDAVSNISPTVIIVTLLTLLFPFILLGFLAYAHQEKPLPPPPGCRKLGLQGKSNLADQFSPTYSQGNNPGTNPSRNPLWRVKALLIYPLKSCKGIELDKSDVIRTGLKYDRQFTLAQYVTSLPTLQGKVHSEWQFITQRTFPRLAKVETEIWVPDPSAPGYSPDAEFVKSEGCLVVRFPFSPDADMNIEGAKILGRILAARWKGNEPMVEFRVPFNPSVERIKKMRYKSEKVTVWKDSPEALNMGCEIPEEILAKLRYTLGVANPLTLFRIDARKYREVYKCAPKKKDVGFQTVIGMADSYPLHIMNLASVHHVASQLPKGYPKSLSAVRYRANIYITGPPPFAEDSWTKARIGDCTYHISCRTTRCKLPNVDPETGIADRNEPGTTMRKYRVVDNGSNSACLGMQVTPLEEGVVNIGDEVEVLEEGEHFFLKE